MPLKQCCCCCSLRTGVIVLGWLHIIFAAIEVNTVILGFKRIRTSSIPGNHHNITNTTEDSDIFSNQDEQESWPYEITAIIIALMAYVLLLVGAIKGNRYLLIPYLIWEKLLTAVVILAAFLLLTVFVWVLSTGDRSEKVTEGMTMLLVYLVILFVYIGVSIYFGMCVTSLFRELRQRRPSDETPLISSNGSLVINEEEPSTPALNQSNI